MSTMKNLTEKTDGAVNAQKDKKKTIIAIIIAVILLAGIGIGGGVIINNRLKAAAAERSLAERNAELASAAERENLLKLVQSYLSREEYDHAMTKSDRSHVVL